MRKKRKFVLTEAILFIREIFTVIETVASQCCINACHTIVTSKLFNITIT